MLEFVLIPKNKKEHSNLNDYLFHLIIHDNSSPNIYTKALYTWSSIKSIDDNFKEKKLFKIVAFKACDSLYVNSKKHIYNKKIKKKKKKKTKKIKNYNTKKTKINQ